MLCAQNVGGFVIKSHSYKLLVVFTEIAENHV